MRYFAGIDLGGTFVKCGIVSSTGELILKDKIPTGARRPYAEIAADMAELVLSLAQKTGVRLEAAGIGSPGTVDSANGVVVYSNNIKWENVPLAGEMKKLLNMSVYTTNDANAAALGESYMGAGKNYKSSVLVTLGTGVGGGVVLNGELYEGFRSAGAEIGHILIKANGERCTCGRRGCFEAYASATALIKQTKSAMKKDANSVMWKLCGGNIENVDGKTAFDGARAGDKTAVNTVNCYVGYLAAGLTDVCNLLRPEAILIGGGISAEGDTLLKPLKELVYSKIFGGMRYAPVEILAASLGNDAGVYGSARLAMKKSGY